MIFDYLFYKLYRANLVGSLKDIAQYAASIHLSLLITANIMVLNAFFAKINIGHFIFKDPKAGGWFTAVLIILAMLYYRKGKYTALINRYSQENENARKRGNFIVATYVLISFLSIFAVAFFRPGKL